jgi:acyl carrier protein
MYNLEHIKSVIRETIENRGLNYTEDEALLDLDSMQFISMIIEFEQALNITIDDDYLFLDRFSSFVNIENTLIDILENSLPET